MASIQTLVGTTLMILMLVIVGAISLKIVADISDLIDNNKTREVTNKGVEAIDVIFKWLPLVAMVVIAAVVLFLLFRGVFASVFGGGKRGE